MSSLQGTTTQTDWIGTMILLSRAPKYYKKLFVILEGVTDISFFNTNAANEKIHYDTPNSGKPEVIQAVQSLRNYGISTVYGICDADFDHISGVNYDNVYFTDFHDLEMMLIEGGVVDRFIDGHTRHEYLRNKNRELFKNEIKENIISTCYSIGILKWLNYKLSLNLNFKGMRYADFLNIEEIKVNFNLELFIHHIMNRSRNCPIEYDAIKIKEEYNTLKECEEDYRNICNGHDFMHILALVFRNEFSTDRNMSIDKVEPLMRMGYSSDKFRQTRLYSSIESTIAHH